MEQVQQAFPERVFSRFRDILWPPRTPDRAILDYFPLGFLKSRVYIDKPCILVELKEDIRREIQAIQQEMLQDSMRNFREHLEKCIQSKGGNAK